MNKIHSQKPSKLKYFLLLFAVIAVGLVGFFLYQKSQEQKPQAGVIKSKTSETKPNSNSTKPNNSNGSNSDKITSVGQSNDNSALLAPYGSLVSNHKPGQNGSNLIILSQCITTPGASCKIEFKKDGVTRALPTQTTDSTGMTVWQWKVDDTGLTKGDWEITALASKNGQSKTTTDTILMEVK